MNSKHHKTMKRVMKGAFKANAISVYPYWFAHMHGWSGHTQTAKTIHLSVQLAIAITRLQMQTNCFLITRPVPFMYKIVLYSIYSMEKMASR